MPILSSWRHVLHQNPELGFEEHRKAAFVARELEDCGYEVTTGIAHTGVVGTLRTGEGPAIGLRADMDALPMEEQSGVAWTSRVPGVFHGCGHDGHTVSLLAAARQLAETRNFCGTLHVIFQPAEEGLGGGRRMVEEGLFDRFPCEQVFGFHNMPLMPFGSCSVRPGTAMASFDEFKVTFAGLGGHAAMPHLTRDCVLALAETAVALQGLVSREIDPHAAAVLSVTQIHVGSTHNVIADSGWLGGTVRSLDEGARDVLETGLLRICQGVASLRDVAVSVDYRRQYPVLGNDPAATASVAAVMAAIFGEGFNADFPPLLASEDFAYMLERCPGAYLLFGQGRDENSPMVHDPRYDFDDALIPVIASTLVAIVEQEMPQVF